VIFNLFSYPRQCVRPLLAAIFSAFLIAACAPGDTGNAPPPQDRTMALIKEWVQGQYNNVAQFEADMAAGLPPEKTHRPMHQLFVPMDAPQLEGHIVYQQSSMDGSENPALIFRHGLMQYLPDPESSAVIQRELYFKDAESYKNLHRNPELLADITLEDMTWNEGCDFFLRANDAGDMISGPLPPGKCVLFNQGTQENMYADDRVEITATDYRFLGRYVDDDGNIVWGTSSDELNSMTRQSVIE